MRRTNPIQKSRIDFFFLLLTYYSKQYVKFHTSLANDESYVKSIKENIGHWRSEIEEVNDYRLKWEYLKYKVRDFTIIVSKWKDKQTNESEKYLTNNLKILEEKIDLDDEELLEYNEIKSKLEEHISEKTRGSLLKSKTQWYEEDDKSTKYLFYLEKRNTDKNIKKLISENGNIISNPTEILKAKQHCIGNYIVLGTLANTAMKQNYFSIKNCLNYLMTKNYCVIMISQLKMP